MASDKKGKELLKEQINILWAKEVDNKNFSDKAFLELERFKDKINGLVDKIIGEELKKLREENIELRKTVVRFSMKKGRKALIKGIMPRLSYTLVQCAMFVVHYGLGYKMPSWVVWFPTWIYAAILILLLIFWIIFALIGGALESV